MKLPLESRKELRKHDTQESNHTIHGDANITDDIESIRNLMNMSYDIKR